MDVASSELEGGGWLAELAAEDAEDSAGWISLFGRVLFSLVARGGGAPCRLGCEVVGVDARSSTATALATAAKGKNPPDELSSSSSASPSELSVPSACDFFPSGARLKA